MPDLKHSISIDASEASIRARISSAAGFSEWWTADSEPKDGAVDVGFYSRKALYRLRPSPSPNGVLWRCEGGGEWTGTSLHFRFEATGKSTLARFVHSDWQKETEYFVSCNTTWGELLYRLKGAAEGKAPGPLFSMDGLA